MEDLNFNCGLLLGLHEEEEIEDDELFSKLTDEVTNWVTYCRIAYNHARKYYRKQRRRIKRFSFLKNGHVFMKEAIEENGQMCFQEFQMYPQELQHFVHILCDEYGLYSSQHVDIYEKVEMFLCILAHEKGYHRVTTIFNHSLQMVCRYFKEVLRVVVALSTRLIKLSQNYNDEKFPYRSDPNKHPLFQDCIGAIDEIYVEVVIQRHECVNVIGRRGVLTQNVLAACDFNLCFN